MWRDGFIISGNVIVKLRWPDSGLDGDSVAIATVANHVIVGLATQFQEPSIATETEMNMKIVVN